MYAQRRQIRQRVWRRHGHDGSVVQEQPAPSRGVTLSISISSTPDTTALPRRTRERGVFLRRCAAVQGTRMPPMRGGDPASCYSGRAILLPTSTTRAPLVSSFTYFKAHTAHRTSQIAHTDTREPRRSSSRRVLHALFVLVRFTVLPSRSRRAHSCTHAAGQCHSKPAIHIRSMAVQMCVFSSQLWLASSGYSRVLTIWWLASRTATMGFSRSGSGTETTTGTWPPAGLAPFGSYVLVSMSSLPVAVLARLLPMRLRPPSAGAG